MQFTVYDCHVNTRRTVVEPEFLDDEGLRIVAVCHQGRRVEKPSNVSISHRTGDVSTSVQISAATGGRRPSQVCMTFRPSESATTEEEEPYSEDPSDVVRR